MDQLETLRRLCRERRHSFGTQEQRSDCFVIFNRNGHVVHIGQFADAEAFLKTVALVPLPDKNTRHRILTAATRKRRLWFEQLGEDSYRLRETVARGNSVILENVGFRDLIAYLDDQGMQQ